MTQNLLPRRTGPRPPVVCRTERIIIVEDPNGINVTPHDIPPWDNPPTQRPLPATVTVNTPAIGIGQQVVIVYEWGAINVNTFTTNGNVLEVTKNQGFGSPVLKTTFETISVPPTILGVFYNNVP